jgi:hypothetical protein
MMLRIVISENDFNNLPFLFCMGSRYCEKPVLVNHCDSMNMTTLDLLCMSNIMQAFV